MLQKGGSASFRHLAEPTKMKFEFRVGKKDEKKRLDIFLKMRMEEFSRNQIQKWIASGKVLRNGAVSHPAQKLSFGDLLSVFPPEEEITAVGEKLPLEILYEDEVLLAVNKPSGMVTHPAKGNFRGTLTNAVVYHLRNSPAALKKLEQNPLRPGIVHRLDKETSGVLLIAKNRFALENLADQFRARTVKKVYRAVVEGKVPFEKGEIDGAIGWDPKKRKMVVTPAGRPAVSSFRVLKKFSDSTYLEVLPVTGRTHQIRVHLARIGHPVLGDSVYGNKREEVPRLMLHALAISVFHPQTKKRMTFSAPLPKDFTTILSKMKIDG